MEAIHSVNDTLLSVIPGYAVSMTRQQCWVHGQNPKPFFSVLNLGQIPAFSLVQHIAGYVEALCYQKIKTLNLVLGPIGPGAFYMQVHLDLHVY